MVFGGHLEIWTADGNFGEMIMKYLFYVAPGVPWATGSNFMKIMNEWHLADISIYQQLMVILGK